MLLIIKPLEPKDFHAVLALNEASMQFTAPLDMNELADLVDQSRYARGIGEPLQAFLIAMDEKSSYDSMNHLWFRERHLRFLYIDRIVVDQAARGNGFGRALYADLFAFAQDGGYDRVCCEVNFDPPNPVSDAFHKALGFVETGRATIHDGLKTVRYLEKMI
ncbi:MAG TPA: GNAT family N-acetyltransferase [Hyphomicrobiales bacterium]|nr:GNAT family N-acetyltransferase [Hyphomicrobiales bacterium]